MIGKARRHALIAALLLSGCGYVGEPRPPLLNIPSRVTNLKAVERGAKIVIQFTMPPLTTESVGIAKPLKIELRAGVVGDSFNAQEWASRAVLLNGDRHEQGQVVHETSATPWIGKDVIFGLKVFGASGRDAGWSNFVTLSVVASVETPREVKTESIAEGVRIAWRGSAPQYRVFRRVGDATDWVLAATVSESAWLDAGIEYGKRYRYSVQGIKKAGASEAGSEISDVADITPIDTFAPAIPAGLNAIAATENIELVWERNTEADLGGYRVYRGADDAKLERIADTQESPAYSDRKIESGKRYRYAVSSMDRLGNESKFSEPVEVTAP